MSLTTEQMEKPKKVFINNLDDLLREVIAFEPRIITHKGIEQEGVQETKKDSNPDERGNEEHNDCSLPLLWYRGNAQSDFNLIPRLYRRIKVGNGKFWEQLALRERELLADFKIRNYHMISRSPENELTWMSMMQHYGTSTRLLDWSEQLLVSLFFALDDYVKKLSAGVDFVPCLWCLKPLELNKFTIKNMGLEIETNKLPDMFSITSTGKSKSRQIFKKNYLSRNSVTSRGKSESSDVSWSLALLSPYNNERIRAQSGTFTIFPSIGKSDVASLNDCAMENLPSSHLFLRQFIILKPIEVKHELRAIGFKKSLIFPELPVISDELDQDIFDVD